MFAIGLTVMFSFLGLGLYALCLERQTNFEDRLVELEELKAEHRVLLVSNHRMRERVAHLETNEGIEEVAREKLGLVRPGELAYAVVPPPPDSFTVLDEEESPHLDTAALKADQQEDFGLIVRVLRHLFGSGPTTAKEDKPETAQAPNA